MKKIKLILILAIIVLLNACGNNGDIKYASGIFEATEIIVSSEVSGKILKFNLDEGQKLRKNQVVGLVDTTQLYLKKLQTLANRDALKASKPDVKVQIEATQNQIAYLKSEKRRIENLLAGDVATKKQLDDINSNLLVLESQLSALKNNLHTNVNALDAKIKGLDVQLLQIEDQIKRSIIKSPIDGTVLVKYAEENELTGAGKPLFKIANLTKMIMKVYVTKEQVDLISLRQQVTVYDEVGVESSKEYDGKVTWISDEAEFTPKTIKTQDERANLVYAVKVATIADGEIKIGSYGGIKF